VSIYIIILIDVEAQEILTCCAISINIKHVVP